MFYRASKVGECVRVEIIEAAGTITDRKINSAEMLDLHRKQKGIWIGRKKDYPLSDVRAYKITTSKERGWSDERVPKHSPEKQWAAWAMMMFIHMIYEESEDRMLAWRNGGGYKTPEENK